MEGVCDPGMLTYPPLWRRDLDVGQGVTLATRWINDPHPI